MKFLILFFISLFGFQILAQQSSNEKKSLSTQTQKVSEIQEISVSFPQNSSEKSNSMVSQTQKNSVEQKENQAVEDQKKESEIQEASVSFPKNSTEKSNSMVSQAQNDSAAAEQRKDQTDESQKENSEIQAVSAFQQPTPTESQNPDVTPVQDVNVYSPAETTATPTPHYNPFYPQYDDATPSKEETISFFGEDEDVAPEQHKFSNRLAFSGRARWGRSGSSNHFLNLRLNADFSWVWRPMEFGPFVRLDTPNENLRQSSRYTNYATELRFLIGLFVEFGFIDYNKPKLKYVPAVGLKVGYGREYNRNLIQIEPYASLRYFISDRTAVFASLSPYYAYKLDGGSEWGVNVPIGVQIYFR